MRDEADHLARAVDRGRFTAAVGADFAVDLETWTAVDGRELFVRVATEVSRQLRAGGPIETVPIAARSIFEDSAPILRRVAGPGVTLDPEPIALVGDALAGMVGGTFPAPPSGTWWFVGVPDDPGRTIRMRPNAGPG